MKPAAIPDWLYDRFRKSLVTAVQYDLDLSYYCKPFHDMHNMQLEFPGIPTDDTPNTEPVNVHRLEES